MAVMQAKALTDFPCDACGSQRAEEIPSAAQYTGGWPLHVCSDCGFVYVRARRSAQAIADSWSNELYETHYTARIPAVVARQSFVAEFAHQALDLKGKRVCDIGAGEGYYLDRLRDKPYGAEVFGVEPSAANGRLMEQAGIAHFVGTIEAYRAVPDVPLGSFDVAMVLWTLENCQSCRTMLDAAWDLLAPGGALVVATGSRILVPFKKPLHYYLGPGDQDTHCFRFSRNSLAAVLANSYFAVERVNRDIDSDVLCVVARKVERGAAIERRKDDPAAVLDFFARWHTETQNHYANA
jgi:2-polyprenyl-3-methyl-5-hydroxy-6-metoxy-1,4-benzoquinol methylase